MEEFLFGTGEYKQAFLDALLAIASLMGTAGQAYSSHKRNKAQTKMMEDNVPGIRFPQSPLPPSGNYMPASMLRDFMLRGRR